MMRYKLYRDRKNCTCTHMAQNADGLWVKYADVQVFADRADQAVRILNERIDQLQNELRAERARKSGGGA